MFGCSCQPGETSHRIVIDSGVYFRYIDRACDTWEEILYNYPTDAFVARLLQNGYYFLGDNERMRDSIARVLPQWSSSHPLYGYLLGIYSFGLCETRDFEKAAVMAHKVRQSYNIGMQKL